MWDTPICAEQRDSLQAVTHILCICGLEQNPFIHFGKQEKQGAGAAQSAKSINYTWQQSWRRDEVLKLHVGANPELY